MKRFIISVAVLLALAAYVQVSFPQPSVHRLGGRSQNVGPDQTYGWVDSEISSECWTSGEVSSCGAVRFVPSEWQEARSKTLKPADDMVAFNVVDGLRDRCSFLYPDVQIVFYPYSNVVNSFATKVGERRYITVLGGLTRNKFLGEEGLSLVFAHEIGHHYGGAPQSPDWPWSSCEGQADYWAAAEVMKKIWEGEYEKRLKEGAKQLYTLLEKGLVRSDPTGFNLLFLENQSVACGYPRPPCRYDTFLAGLNGGQKPSCAN